MRSQWSPQPRKTSFGVGGRRTWEAKHGEITSSAVACCSNLHRICSVGLQLLDWSDIFFSVLFRTLKRRFNFERFEGPQVPECSGCLVATRWLPLFSLEGCWCKARLSTANGWARKVYSDGGKILSSPLA